MRYDNGDQTVWPVEHICDHFGSARWIERRLRATVQLGDRADSNATEIAANQAITTHVA
jgi:hypothetical protein